MTAYELASKYLICQIILISWTQWDAAAWLVDSSNLSSSAFTYVLLASSTCSQYVFHFFLPSPRFCFWFFFLGGWTPTMCNAWQSNSLSVLQVVLNFYMNSHLLYINHNRSFTKTISSSHTKKFEFSITVPFLQAEIWSLERLYIICPTSNGMRGKETKFQIISTSNLPAQADLQTCLLSVWSFQYILPNFLFFFHHTTKFSIMRCPILAILKC